MWTDLLECLELMPATPDGTAVATGSTASEGRNQQLEYHQDALLRVKP
jgi:hypothetical protein